MAMRIKMVRGGRDQVRSQRGFSMIELLMVVAIIGILAVIAIPQLSQYRAKAYNSAARADLYNLRAMMETAYHDQGQYTLP